MSRRAIVLGIAGAAAAGLAAQRLGTGEPPAEPPLRVAAELDISGTWPAGPVAMEEAPLPSDTFVVAEESAPIVEAPPPVATAAPPAPVAPPAPAKPRAAEPPAWQRNGRPVAIAGDRPAIAIVIDDLGLDHVRTEHAVALAPAVTLAFMTYAEKLPAWAATARGSGHEYLLHVPMQPESAHVDPGPNALVSGLSESEIRRRLRWGLDRLDGHVGVNNHMGSRFTADAAGMRIVMEELKARGLLFLDSRTTPRTAAGDAAAAAELPFASRNIFLDNEPTPAAVRAQILALETLAQKHGSAIAIGHPHDATLAVLAEWLAHAASRGNLVVPLTSVMRRQSALG